MAFLDNVKGIAKTIGEKTTEVAKTVGEKTSEVAKTVGEKTSEVAKTVGDKTNETIEVTKLKAKISSEKSSISEIKKQIGDLVWEEYSAGSAEFSENIAVLCASIKEHQDVIDKAEADIETTKNKSAEPAEEPVEEVVEDVTPAEDTTEE